MKKLFSVAVLMFALTSCSDDKKNSTSSEAVKIDVNALFTMPSDSSGGTPGEVHGVFARNEGNNVLRVAITKDQLIITKVCGTDTSNPVKLLIVYPLVLDSRTTSFAIPQTESRNENGCSLSIEKGKGLLGFARNGTILEITWPGAGQTKAGYLKLADADKLKPAVNASESPAQQVNQSGSKNATTPCNKVVTASGSATTTFVEEPEAK